jgi:hypothetical protein
LAAALEKAGVNYVDTEALARLSTAAGSPPWFGKYGQHWNDVGHFYAVRAIIESFRQQSTAKVGTLQIDKTWIDQHPLGDEADTGLLSNFLFSLYPESPHLNISLVGDKPPIRLMFVGTSFSGGLIDVFLKMKLTQKIVLYNYFKWIFTYMPPDIANGPSLEASEDYRERLNEVDAVVLEVNASALGSSHVSRFIEATDRLR